MWYINKRTDKNHRVLLINTEKSLENVKHSFTIKIVIKVVIEGIYQNIIKVIYDTPTANIILNSEMLRDFPLKSGTRQWCLLLLFLFKISSVQFSRSVVSDSLRPHESQHARPSVHHQLPEFTQTHVFVVITIAMRQAKEIKVIQIRREEIRLPLVSYDMK